MKKYEYQIHINGGCDTTKSIEGHYKRTTLNISYKNNAASLCFSLSKKYEDISSSNYIIEMIKEYIRRLEIMYYLKHGKPFDIKEVIVHFPGNNKMIQTENLANRFEMDFMLKKTTVSNISTKLKSLDVINSLLSEYTSKQEHRMASVYAYIYSKTITLETERLVYLWMAMNGLYSQIAPKGKNGKEINDTDKINHLAKKYNLGLSISYQTNREKLALKTKKVLASSYLNKKDQLLNDSESLYKDISTIIGEKKFVDLTPYGYVLLDFAYYLRNNLFHANKPMSLISFKENDEIKVLKYVNDLLEEFLDEHLCDCFIESKE